MHVGVLFRVTNCDSLEIAQEIADAILSDESHTERKIFGELKIMLNELAPRSRRYR